MKIELKKIKLYPALSEETNAYSAEVHVDGKAMIAASNDGHGGCDRLYPLQGFNYADIQKVEAFVAANEPALELGEGYEPSPCDLEILIGRLIARNDAEKRIARMVKKQIVAVKDGNVYQFKAEPNERNLSVFKLRNPDYRIVNEDAGALAEAVSFLLAA